MSWEPVIGLEIHAQLNTRSKIFSNAPTAYGALPNTQACDVDLGLPGVLPVLNGEAVHKAIKFGLSIGAEIPSRNIFARKNYFYPDLPKGYQISQFEHPIVKSGRITIILGDEQKPIGITRAHLEEDAGKSIHDAFTEYTAIDLNRAGTPLLEIVSEPDLRSAKEAVAYAKTIHALLRYLDICDGNMQEGSFRVDANVSIRPNSDSPFGTRAEVKNINSFRFLERAINYEIERQTDLLESGQKVAQETRLFDPDKNETRSMRSKEEAHDYRYFPDPDLLPVEITAALLDQVKSTLPELPDAKRLRFIEQYQLSEYDARVLTTSRDLADYFETTVKETKQPKLTVNWVMGDLSASLNKADLDITETPVSASQLAGLISRIADNTISGKIAKEVFETLWQQEGKTADDIIANKGLQQLSDVDAIAKVIDEIIAANPEQTEQYRQGKDKLFGFFVGQVMKATQGKANPAQLNELLKQKLL